MAIRAEIELAGCWPGGCLPFAETGLGTALILFQVGRDLGGIAGGLQRCAQVLLELWAENTLERNLLSGMGL
jgi:hypothetical protein